MRYLVGLLLLGSVGCVSTQKYQKVENENLSLQAEVKSTANALERCTQKSDDQQVTIDQYAERLRRFNQLDEDGVLRVNDDKPRSKSWMK